MAVKADASLAYSLVDARLIELECKRFVEPTESPKGKVRSNIKHQVKATDEPNTLVAIVSMELQGIPESISTEQAVSAEFAFIASCKMEGLFAAENLTRKAVIDKRMVSHLCSRLHPLVAMTLRENLTRAGFKGLELPLGIRNSDVVEEGRSIESEKANKPKKRVNKSRSV